MNIKKYTYMVVIIVCLILAGCSSASNNKVEQQQEQQEHFPITIKHAFGETTISQKPKKIASIAWGNQDVPLALGIVPVGVSKANYGANSESGLLPWTYAKFKDLGVDKPLLFNDVDNLDFEAISNTQPDVILAAYSGITKEDYALLSKIAPVIAYPDQPWQTLWREQITMNAMAIGLKDEGEALVTSLEGQIQKELKKYPELKGKRAAFFYFNPADLGKFYIYLPADPRVAYLNDLGMQIPESVKKLASSSNSFTLELSSEHIETLQDVDIVVAYGNDELLRALQSDALLKTMPAIKRGSVALIEDGSALAASTTPSALSIPVTISDYTAILANAAKLVK